MKPGGLLQQAGIGGRGRARSCRFRRGPIP